MTTVRQNRITPLAVMLLALLAPVSEAYVRITSSTNNQPRWPSFPIAYAISDAGNRQIANGSEFLAVHSAFQTWARVPAADVSFDFRGTTPNSVVGRDGTNLITFTDEVTPLGATTIAATFSFFEVRNNSIVTVETDVSFNTAFEFSTSGEADKYDIQGVLTHEIGHVLGLDHSALVSAVMAPFSSIGQIDQRVLTYDDMAGAAEIYPRPGFSATVGSIQGTVRSGLSSIFGANVVALDTNGTAVTSTLTQRDGSFVIRAVPPGAYRVYAEPLDRPVQEQNVGGGANSYYRNIHTDFGTTFAGNVPGMLESQVVDVAAERPATVDIQVLPRSSSGLNLTGPSVAARVARGSRTTLRLGGEDITAGVSIASSSPSLLLGSPVFGGRLSSTQPTSVSLPLDIPADAPLGPKSMIATRGAATAITSGAVVVTGPRPSQLQIDPATGPADGGTAIRITGRDLMPGAQIYFGGLPAASVVIVDSATALGTTPRNAPGAVHVQVINPDGAAGVIERGFSFTSEPPRIFNVTPLAGPPGAVIQIDGERFDTRPAFVEVLFNGVPGRVTRATATSINVIVPFGAVSGPLSVRLFGQTALGPDFNIQRPAASTNTAPPGYRFVDASVEAGGTGLTFASNDDAMAYTTLPFGFSLFGDGYLAGSRVSISTNGWLSLESVSAAEFQNPSLPAATVQRPGGNTGIVAPALIAPFFDDLFLRGSNSSVSVRTVGGAPDRQFVVQWTNLGILDEQSADTGAGLTFEAVLFEGSNDIQFVYRSVQGSRADGSSATIGIQDLSRTRAVQFSFNSAVLSGNLAVPFRFRDGLYLTEARDSTPPSKPVVIDGGAVTSSVELFANWSAEDRESGIREYEFAIGRTPGGTDVRGFTGTPNSSAIVTGLGLDTTSTYYFSVRAVNGAGLVGETAVSDGIRYDPRFTPQRRILPSVQHGAGRFGGIALQTNVPVSVVLRANDPQGNAVFGPGIRNPTTVTLGGGRQFAGLIGEIFGMDTFDGWVEIESSSPGIGVYYTNGANDLSQMDGANAADLLTEFVVFHPGLTTLVNPSVRSASVTFSEFGGLPRTITLQPRSRFLLRTSTGARLRSSEPLAALEQHGAGDRFGLAMPVAVGAAAGSLVIPHGVAGGGLSTTVILANVSGVAQDVNVTSGFARQSIRVDGNGLVRVPLTGSGADAIRIAIPPPLIGNAPASLVAVADIESASALTTVAAVQSATAVTFPHVAHGGGLFTGLALATGVAAADVSIDVVSPSGAVVSAIVHIGGNSQIAKTISELVPGVGLQSGGFIRLRSTQPIWSWEIYGSDRLLASGPPL